MLHSVQHKKADAATKSPIPDGKRTAAAKNNPYSAPDPFPHPPGSTRCPKKWTSKITDSPHPRGPSRPVRKLQSNLIPLHEGINLICEGRDAQNKPLFLPRRNQPPAPDHIRPLDTLSQHEEINQGPRRRPNSGNPHPRKRRDQPQVSEELADTPAASSQTRGSTQAICDDGA